MSAFEACHAITHQWEKGYANHPRDPGGATMDGVTQRVYDAFRRKEGRPLQPVRRITHEEKLAIYERQYWQAVHGDNLPPGLDLVVYDMAVNSGPSRGIRYLQAALGLKQDGHMGEVTLAALQEAYDRDDDDAVIKRYMDARERFLRSLGTFDVFGKGWMNRTRDVRAKAMRMEQIEDVARAFRARGKAAVEATKNKRTTAEPLPLPKPPVVYRPDKATSAPAEPAVRGANAAKTSGWLGGLAAAASAAQAAIGGVRETLDGIVPNGGVIALAVIVTVGIGAAAYAWQQWREADVSAEPQAETTP
jgi:lysozyme family protein